VARVFAPCLWPERDYTLTCSSIDICICEGVCVCVCVCVCVRAHVHTRAASHADNTHSKFKMHWVGTFVFLHTMGIILNIPYDKIVTTTRLDWLCSSTMGCTMNVGLNEERLDDMDSLCATNNAEEIANSFATATDDGQAVAFSCIGSTRCCRQCTLPLPSAPTHAVTRVVVVTTHDELRVIFSRCLVIMVAVLAMELLVGTMMACSIHVQQIETSKDYKGIRRTDTAAAAVDIVMDIDIHMDMVIRREDIISRWKLVRLVSEAIGLVVLVAEMCLLIALVIVPAVSRLRNTSCFIYVVMYAIVLLTIYACLGLLLERYITLATDRNTKHSCMDMCFWKVLLSFMGAVMWLLSIWGIIVGSIYCAVIASNST
jgi:hypothetical protein